MGEVASFQLPITSYEIQDFRYWILLAEALALAVMAVGCQ
jgi:hypothetical protein